MSSGIPVTVSFSTTSTSTFSCADDDTPALAAASFIIEDLYLLLKRDLNFLLGSGAFFGSSCFRGRTSFGTSDGETKIPPGCETLGDDDDPPIILTPCLFFVSLTTASCLPEP